MSTVLSTWLQSLGSLQRLYSPRQVTMGGTRVYIGVVGLFGVVLGWKVDSFSNWTPRAWLSVSKVSIRFKNECKLTSPFSV